ncbi:MAG: hypothetical protein K8M05_33465 [Deltaproteobacteria bacterium]|nr:hypothetical protein [Kofleriaceae bacterium]
MRSLLVAIALALLLAGCIVRYVTGPKLTGTCDGACDHYERCKGGVDDDVKKACREECPQVFSDRDSLMAFESLSCEDTVEYVEGPSRRPPGSPTPIGGQARQ